MFATYSSYIYAAYAVAFLLVTSFAFFSIRDWQKHKKQWHEVNDKTKA